MHWCSVTAACNEDEKARMKNRWTHANAGQGSCMCWVWNRFNLINISSPFQMHHWSMQNAKRTSSAEKVSTYLCTFEHSGQHTHSTSSKAKLYHSCSAPLILLFCPSLLPSLSFHYHQKGSVAPETQVQTTLCWVSSSVCTRLLGGPGSPLGPRWTLWSEHQVCWPS